MTTIEQVRQMIEKEFFTAVRAKQAGNDGMVRVCARRAAGAAIALWLQSNPRIGWGVDAMHQLRSLQGDETMPPHIRGAAERLTTKVTENFVSAFTTDPVEDSKTIIDYLIEKGSH